jgi:hypothetical protein
MLLLHHLLAACRANPPSADTPTRGASHPAFITASHPTLPKHLLLFLLLMLLLHGMRCS